MLFKSVGIDYIFHLRMPKNIVVFIQFNRKRTVKHVYSRHCVEGCRDMMSGEFCIEEAMDAVAILREC